MKNWKTTVTGILTIVTAAISITQALINGNQPDWTATIAAVTAGLGLIFAKDSNVTGGTVQQ